MQRFEASTLEEAYAQAARAFTCSVTDLQIVVVQHPSRGFLGFGRKNAVIDVEPPRKAEEPPLQEEPRPVEPKPEERVEVIKAEESESKELEDHTETLSDADEHAAIEAVVQEVIRESAERESTAVSQREIFDNFYNEKPDIHAVVPEVREKLQRLFDHACFDIEPVEVSVWDDETLLVEFNGKDAALLIGKEGYRYKALAHLLYNWIHGSYGFHLRLEIAEFLKNQEAMIENYLQSVVERVENEGRAQTKVLDGILVQIALRKLRERYPDKYVAIRSNREGGRYVIVNEFMEKR